MTLNIDDVMEVLRIIKECKDTELYIDSGDMKLSLAKGKVSGGGVNLLGSGAVEQAVAAEPAPVASLPATEPEAEAEVAPHAVEETEAVSEEGLEPVKANVTSVFYRRPSPEDPPFVEVGDVVEEDTVVCLLEVMKCFQQVMAGVRGRIEKICVEGSHLVEEGTVMFLIRPE